MQDQPISDFLNRLQSFHVNDIAVLMWLVAIQERSFPISPAAATGKWFPFDGATEEELEESFKRLLLLGEVEEYSDEQFKGYRVKRFDELRESMQDFGRRSYFRSVSKKKEVQS